MYSSPSIIRTLIIRTLQRIHFIMNIIIIYKMADWVVPLFYVISFIWAISIIRIPELSAVTRRVQIIEGPLYWYPTVLCLTIWRSARITGSCLYWDYLLKRRGESEGQGYCSLPQSFRNVLPCTATGCRSASLYFSFVTIILLLPFRYCPFVTVPLLLSSLLWHCTSLLSHHTVIVVLHFIIVTLWIARPSGPP